MLMFYKKIKNVIKTKMFLQPSKNIEINAFLYNCLLKVGNSKLVKILNMFLRKSMLI